MSQGLCFERGELQFLGTLRLPQALHSLREGFPFTPLLVGLNGLLQPFLPPFLFLFSLKDSRHYHSDSPDTEYNKLMAQTDALL